MEAKLITTLMIDCGVAMTRAVVLRNDKLYSVWLGPALGDENIAYEVVIGHKYSGRVLRADKITKTAFMDIGAQADVFVRLGRGEMPIEGALYEVEILKAARGTKKATAKIIRPQIIRPQKTSNELNSLGPLEPIPNAIVQAWHMLMGVEEQGIDGIIVSCAKAKLLIDKFLLASDLQIPVSIDGLAFQHIEEEQSLNDIFFPYLTLQKGGVLTINEAEAITAIDVDMGSMTGGEGVSRDKLIENLNKEAAQAVLEQIVLRRLGGQIVIDFLPMRKPIRQRFDGWLRDQCKTLQGFSRASWTHSDLFSFVLPRAHPSLLDNATQIGVEFPICGRVFTNEFWLKSTLCALEIRMRKMPSMFFTLNLSSTLTQIFMQNSQWKKRFDETYGGRLIIAQQDAYSRLETRIDERH